MLKIYKYDSSLENWKYWGCRNFNAH